MIAKSPSWSYLPAANAEREGSVKALAPEGRGRGFSLTSHSFTLNTKLFNLDVSWKRLEVDGRKQANSQPHSVASPSRPSPAPARPGPMQAKAPSFSEVLKRQQLASLLMDTASPPPANNLETIQARAKGPNQAFAGSAHRAYRSASHNGPLGSKCIYKA